jgi:hypothetical protein
MAIEQLGESLLSDIRTRNAQAAKRARKQEEKNALIGLGVNVLGKIGNQMLSDKMTTFLNNENMLAENAQFKAATNVANFWSPRIEAVNKSGKDAVDYYYETMRPVFEEQAKAEINFGVAGDAGQYNALINSKVRELAEQEAKRHNEATKLIGKLGTEEEFDAKVALVAKNARPTNLFDMGYKTIKRTFSGKSQDQLDAEAIDALQNSKAALAADELLAFQERYAETGSLIQSYDYAKLASEASEKEVDKNVLFDIVKETKYDISDGNFVTFELEQKIRRSDGRVLETTLAEATDESGNKVPAVNFKNLDPDEISGLTLKDRVSQFNYAKDARDSLTPEGYNSFVKAAQDEGILLTNIKSLNEYQKAGEIYRQFNTKEYLVNPRLEGIKQKFLFSWLDETADMSMFLAGITKDPAKKDEYIDRIIDAILTGKDLTQAFENAKKDN